VKPRTSVVLAAVVAALIALPLLVAACGNESTDLATPKVAGTIAFAKAVGKANADIYVVNTDGTGLVPLTDALGWEEDPSWSPDGSKIVYAAYPPGNLYVDTASVWVMSADGSQQIQLSEGYGFSPAWSPDGKQIVYVSVNFTAPLHTPVVVSGTPLRAEVVVMNADGSGGRRLTDTKGFPVAPSWTPTGDVLFLRDGDLYSIKPDGTGEVRLTTDWTIGEYALSPDGRTLAYRDLARNAVVVRSLEGGGAAVTLVEPATRLVGSNPLAALAWTPDGQAVVLAASSQDGHGGSGVFLVNSDGTGLSQVPGVDASYDPTWRPE
jgi:Tol biopolymer transport system component